MVTLTMASCKILRYTVPVSYENRTNQTLVRALIKLTSTHQDHWHLYIDSALYSYRMTLACLCSYLIGKILQSVICIVLHFDKIIIMLTLVTQLLYFRYDQALLRSRFLK